MPTLTDNYETFEGGALWHFRFDNGDASSYITLSIVNRDQMTADLARAIPNGVDTVEIDMGNGITRIIQVDNYEDFLLTLTDDGMLEGELRNDEYIAALAQQLYLTGNDISDQMVGTRSWISHSYMADSTTFENIKLTPNSENTGFGVNRCDTNGTLIEGRFYNLSEGVSYDEILALLASPMPDTVTTGIIAGTQPSLNSGLLLRALATSNPEAFIDSNPYLGEAYDLASFGLAFNPDGSINITPEGRAHLNALSLVDNSVVIDPIDPTVDLETEPEPEPYEEPVPLADGSGATVLPTLSMAVWMTQNADATAEINSFLTNFDYLASGPEGHLGEFVNFLAQNPNGSVAEAAAGQMEDHLFAELRAQFIDAFPDSPLAQTDTINNTQFVAALYALDGVDAYPANLATLNFTEPYTLSYELDNPNGTTQTITPINNITLSDPDFLDVDSFEAYVTQLTAPYDGAALAATAVTYNPNASTPVDDSFADVSDVTVTVDPGLQAWIDTNPAAINQFIDTLSMNPSAMRSSLEDGTLARLIENSLTLFLRVESSTAEDTGASSLRSILGDDPDEIEFIIAILNNGEAITSDNRAALGGLLYTLTGQEFTSDIEQDWRTNAERMREMAALLTRDRDEMERIAIDEDRSIWDVIIDFIGQLFGVDRGAPARDQDATAQAQAQSSGRDSDHPYFQLVDETLEQHGPPGEGDLRIWIPPSWNAEGTLPPLFVEAMTAAGYGGRVAELQSQLNGEDAAAHLTGFTNAEYTLFMLTAVGEIPHTQLNSVSGISSALDRLADPEFRPEGAVINTYWASNLKHVLHSEDITDAARAFHTNGLSTDETDTPGTPSQTYPNGHSQDEPGHRIGFQFT